MAKNSLYTGSGDRGKTSLIGGLRVFKDDPRLDAYGTIDELNAFIGMLIVKTNDAKTVECLQFIQNKLFVVGASLATATHQGNLKTKNRITLEDIEKIESFIDFVDGDLEPMKGFVLPGGCESASWAHICRTVCRRSERNIYQLISSGGVVEESILVFINRLSDLLFVVARNENFQKGENEINWDNACI